MKPYLVDKNYRHQVYYDHPRLSKFNSILFCVGILSFTAIGIAISVEAMMNPPVIENDFVSPNKPNSHRRHQ